jgi:hypothetical protein
MAKRDGAARAAETVADLADAGPAVGDVAAGPSGARGGTDAPGQNDEPGTRDGAAATDEPRSRDAASEAAREEVPVTTRPVGTNGRRAGRFPRPSGPRTPTFGLSLAAIRGPRNTAMTESTEELRRSLADTEAQTNELRQALEALRRALDDTTPGRPAPQEPERPRRRGPLLLALAAALVAVLVVVALVLTRDGRTATAGPVPTPSASAAAPSSPAATASAPSASPPATAAPSATASAQPNLTTQPLPWRGGPVLVPPGLPASGPGITTPGTDVTFALDDDLLHVDVYEQAVLAAPTDVVTVALPPLPQWSGALAGASEPVRPKVEDLQAELDGVPARVQARGDGWFALPPSGSRVTKVVLRYRLSGVTLRYAGSPNDRRRSVAVPPLTARASLDASQPVTLRIDDPRALTMTCTTAAGDTVLCGGQTGSTMTGTLPTGAAPAAFFLVDLRSL